MTDSSRRRFFLEFGASLGAVTIAGGRSLAKAVPGTGSSSEARSPDPQRPSGPVDFRYSPPSGQTAICFPDDPHKGLVGEHGDLRYDHPGQYRDIDYFREIVEFSLMGEEANEVSRQWLEEPAIPIVHTLIDRPKATLELTAFATGLEAEGRVDNVILEVRPRSETTVHATPLVTLKTKSPVKVQVAGLASWVQLNSGEEPPFMMVDSTLAPGRNSEIRHQFLLKSGVAAGDRPSRYFLRFPRQNQSLAELRRGLENPVHVLEEARAYWRKWKPFGGEVSWKLPGRSGEFLVACARNIQQAREVKEGKITFQVGATVYRGLWIADGSFILEAARYLGYDAEAQQGLETTWSRQRPDGGVFAGGGEQHWKETGIALFTLVRQAELSQDWNYFRKMHPAILRAIDYIGRLRDKAKSEDSAMGRYGLLPRGFGDGGLGGIRSEFTNTLWTLAGLKAATEAAQRLGLADFGPARQLYRDLRTAFFAAAPQEMRRHPAGFEYLPMLMKEDPLWSAPDDWTRPRPQTAQWALSHSIYPGLVFEKDDPVVRGYLSLMQACAQEDVPAESGWLPHQGIWNYDAAFVAHVYLWAGVNDWARRTFTGFLNHASPLYCWREEQPVRGSLVADYVGDMPHNWASAECILYLRHRLALEDGQALRLLAGIGDAELADGEPMGVGQSPTRFGRIDLNLEPLDRGAGWSLKFKRDPGPEPASVQLPAMLGSRLRFSEAAGAQTRQEGNVILVAPSAASWQAIWKT